MTGTVLYVHCPICGVSVPASETPEFITVGFLRKRLLIISDHPNVFKTGQHSKPCKGSNLRVELPPEEDSAGSEPLNTEGTPSS